MKMNYSIAYPTGYTKQIKPLLHQQMWLFGRDILYPEGNLLYDYQFAHNRSADKGGAMYTCWRGAQQIVLWGWGIWFGQSGSGAIFVNRYKAQPQHTAVSTLSQTIYKEELLPRRTYRVSSVIEAQTMRKLWEDLLMWLAEYEAWVLSTVGTSWRQASLRMFGHRVTKPESAGELVGLWQTLAEQGGALRIRLHTKKTSI